MTNGCKFRYLRGCWEFHEHVGRIFGRSKRRKSCGVSNTRRRNIGGIALVMHSNIESVRFGGAAWQVLLNVGNIFGTRRPLMRFTTVPRTHNQAIPTSALLFLPSHTPTIANLHVASIEQYEPLYDIPKDSFFSKPFFQCPKKIKNKNCKKMK